MSKDEQKLIIDKDSNNYLTAIDYLTVQTSKINAVTNQINFLTTPAYQPSLLTAVSGVQNQLSAFSSIQSMLPMVDHLTAISPIIGYSREATFDDQIKKWSTNPIHYDKGSPTRKARLLFICRNISNEPFNNFVKKDVDATIAFIDIFQKGTHDIYPVFSPSHLVTIKSKAETTLKFLLEIHYATNN